MVATTHQFGCRCIVTGWSCLVALWMFGVSLEAQNPRPILDRAISDFEAGRLREAVIGFDEVASLVPSVAPQLWQRGIALYYVARYQDCREMFETHRTVNPNDVENAVWHFLCVAREESPRAAHAALLPVGPDGRVPMAEIYQMFQSELTPDDVMDAAARVTGGARPRALFYAHLYVGLYLEATGNEAAARRHLIAAADEEFERAGGYMHTVARVHVDQLNTR